VLGRAPESRLFVPGAVTDTDMVDFDPPAAAPAAPAASPAPVEGELAGRIRRAALSLPTFQGLPAIADEFGRSLTKRTALWEPMFAAVFDELAIEPGDGIVRFLAAWFTLVHLSAPVDQWIDDDPVSPHWSTHRPEARFDLVLALKDEALASLLSEPLGGELLPLARAALELASSALTAAIGTYFDLGGALRFTPERDPREYAVLHERLVFWKSACMYRTLGSGLAVAGGATEAQRTALESFGHRLGYSIQVFDDAGGIWGAGDDLEKGAVVLTFPLIYALNLPHAVADELRSALSRLPSERRVDRVRAMLDETQALAFLEFLIDEGEAQCERDLAALTPATRERLLGWYHDYFRPAGAR
jgi:geranylgeranyl diphosphate synthase type I